MKTKLRLSAVISMMLSIILLIEVPAGAIAPVLGLEESTSDLLLPELINTQLDEEAQIIGEVESERTENSKTFKLSDGTFMVAQYNVPVHYKDSSDEWVDYDNSLTVTEKEISQLETQSPTLGDATADNVAKLENVTYQTEANTQKQQMLKTNKSDVGVSLSAQTSSENMVVIEKDNHTVSWGYKDINPVSVTQKNTKKLRAGNDRFTVLDNLTSAVVYKSAYDGVDIECITTPIGVKENIIISRKTTTNKFVSTYNIDNLRAEKIHDREIAIYNAENEIEYYINALYMYDANNEISEAINLNIIENTDGILVVELVADEQWLNAKERVYPVTIDPSFVYGQEWLTTQSTYVHSGNKDKCYGYGSSGYEGTIRVGTLGDGYCRSLVKVNELPTLKEGDMLVGAYINAHLFQIGFNMDTYVGVYKVEDEWNQSTVTWNTRPDIDDKLLDYVNVNEKTVNDPWCQWDITKLVKEWYDGSANYGVYLRMIRESETPQNVAFYSSGFPTSEIPRPAFQMIYRNNKGVEDRWSYTSFAAGDSSTVHINDYSGALTLQMPIASTADPVFPASVSFTYNSYMANTRYDKNAPFFGDGWRLNVQQTLLTTENTALTEEAQETFPYVYTDADGTEHYFYKKTENGVDKYYDEDGLNLELTINPTLYSKRYLITDKDKNEIYFHSTGLLSRIEDPFDNFIEVVYVKGTTRIDKVVDKTGNEIDFQFNETTKYLESITAPGNKQTLFTYDSTSADNRKVVTVSHPNGRTTSFTYDNNGLITSVIEKDGSKLEFTYENQGAKGVTSVQEYGVNGAEGQKITFNRSKYNETIITTAGVDAAWNTDDDYITTCQFDNCGRTTATYVKTAGGADLGAESYSYTSGSPNTGGTNIQTLNRVSKHHSLGMNTRNFARNTSFESSASWGNNAVFGGSTYTAGVSTAQKLYGNKSYKVNVTSYINDGGARGYQDISNLTAGEKYTLSAYLKVTDITQLAESNSGAYIAATTYTADSSTHFFSEYIAEVTDTSINNGWRRVNVTFEVPTGVTNVRLSLGIRGAVGTAYFDGVQLESGENVGSYNMIQNGSFESYTNYTPTSWSNYRDIEFADEKDYISQIAHDDSKSFSIKGDVALSKALYQEIPVSGSEDDAYILSGWAKTTTAVPVDDRNNRFRLSVHVVYSDGSTKVKDPPNFNTSITDWQFSSYAFTLSDGTSATKTPSAIRVFLTYSKQGNRAYFDNIQLVKEPSQSYTYDDDGNLVSVVSNANQKSTLEYNSDNKLTKQVDAKGYDYKYTYDKNNGALTSATNQRGTTTHFTYDERGTMTSTATVSGFGNKIENDFDVNYPNDESETYTTELTDQQGYITTSEYNSKNGALLSISYGENNVVNYSYDDTDLLESVSQGNAEVSYFYTNNNKYLSSILTRTTLYAFTYDAFGNRTSTKVGNRTLATYSYDDKNGLMRSMKYGSSTGGGDVISYSYDVYGNQNKKYVNDELVYEGFADKSGVITKAIDHKIDLQYNYVYDSTGRLISSTRTNTADNSRVAMFEYGFDLNNNLTKHTLLTPHGNNTTLYTYSEDNFPATATLSNGTVVTHSYNTVSQPNGYSIGINENKNISTAYRYERRPSSDGTYDNITSLIKTEVSDDFGFRYDYDRFGNITNIYENVENNYEDISGTLREAYTYDTLNQLKQATDYTQNKRYVYAYNNGGNITKERVFSLSNTSNTPDETIEYEYGISSWGDLLIKYNGQTITYDEIGNPLNYRDGITFTWSNGRQLDSYTKNGETINYTYDSDGMRRSKTVDGVEHTYLYENGLLIQETKGNRILEYSYDANGDPVMVKYSIPSQNYSTYAYYALNTRGDVIGLYSSTGNLIAKYNYDAWGKVLSVTNPVTTGDTVTEITSSTHVANLQSLRYRSYYYDTETGLYYLQSRYYDPVTHRFVNADSKYIATGTGVLGLNMFAYCDNNPVNFSDPSGTCSVHTNHYMPSCPDCNPELAALHAERGADWASVEKNVNYGFTYSNGLGGSLNIGAIGGSAQIGLTFDIKGNVALQLTLSGSLNASATCSDYSFSFGSFNMITNASSYRMLEGLGHQVGVGTTAPIPYTKMNGFADANINLAPVSYNPDKTYIGYSDFKGISTRGNPDANFHYSPSYTVTIYQFNLYDAFGG